MHIVVFHIRTRPDLDEASYEQAFEEMLAAVSTVPGFVSIDGFAGDDGSELAIVRFQSEDAIKTWRNHPDHVRTRDRGREEFFDSYEITVAEVIRAYEWRQGEPAPTFAVPEAT